MPDSSRHALPGTFDDVARSGTHRSLEAYLLAVALAIAGTAVQWGAHAAILTLDPGPAASFVSFQALFAAVLLSALYCGRGPAALCLLLCAALHLYFFVEPLYSFQIGRIGAALQLLLFMAVGSLVCLVGLRRGQMNEALRASGLRTRQVLNSALDAVISIDQEGHIEEWNPQAETMFGWSRAEVHGTELANTIIPPAYREAHRRGLQRLAQNGEAHVIGRRLELTARRRDGTEFPVELSIARVQSFRKEYFAAFVRDISERQRVESELKASAQQLRTLAESLPNLVWTCRADGVCDYVSPQWVAYTGNPATEPLPSLLFDHLHPDDRERVRSDWTRTVQEHLAYDVEFRIRRHDGTYRWFKTRAVPLRDDRGQVVRWFGSSTDIEENKRSEGRMRMQLERLALLDRITRAIGSHLDMHSVLGIVVRSLEEHLGVDLVCVCLMEPDRSAVTVTSIGTNSRSLAEQIGMSEATRIESQEDGFARCLQGELVHEPDLTTVALPLARRMSGAGLNSVVFAPLAAEKSVFGILLVAARAVHRFSSGDCEFLRQLSEHLALAAQQASVHTSLERAYEDIRSTQKSMLQHERLRALGQLASGIAHDINNALSPAALYTQTLREQEAGLSAEGRKQLGVIQRAIEDVSHTVARMREFYRPQESLAEPTPVNVARMLEEVIQLTRARWLDIPQERGIVIRLQRDFGASVPDVVGVESEIRDAITNLILNAVDAMPTGGTLTIRSRCMAQPDAAISGQQNEAVAIEIGDTGIGMDERARARCLEPFFTTKGERGTGLGLAMVYGMVQRHGGDIQIESALDKGTSVRLIFNVLSKTEAPAAPVSKAPNRTLRILLVDDDPLVLEACRNVLERDGHAVIAAEGGEAGIEAFIEAQSGTRRFELVITDLGMPYVDGRQVAVAVKASAPQTPVILLTGWGHRLRVEDEVPAGVDRVLGKPPKLQELRAALSELTQGNGLHAEEHRQPAE